MLIVMQSLQRSMSCALLYTNGSELQGQGGGSKQCPDGLKCHTRIL